MSSNDAPGAMWRKSSHSNGSGSCVEVGQSWRKSTYSNGQGARVEVAPTPRVVLIRDTTNRCSGPTLTIPARAWQALVAQVRTVPAS